MVFQEGQSGNPAGRPKGSKDKTTLAKEERRAVFDEEVEKIFVDRIKKARPEYVLDQYLGKAPEELNVRQLIVTISKEIAEKNEIASSPESNSERLAPIQGVKVWEEIRKDESDSRGDKGEGDRQAEENSIHSE